MTIQIFLVTNSPSAIFLYSQLMQFFLPTKILLASARHDYYISLFPHQV